MLRKPPEYLGRVVSAEEEKLLQALPLRGAPYEVQLSGVKTGGKRNLCSEIRLTSRVYVSTLLLLLPVLFFFFLWPDLLYVQPRPNLGRFIMGRERGRGSVITCCMHKFLLT